MYFYWKSTGRLNDGETDNLCSNGVARENNQRCAENEVHVSMRPFQLDSIPPMF